MKKLIVILVAVLYLLGLTQLSVSFNHCGKELKYVTFNDHGEKVCCGTKGNKKHCCCKDDEVKYSVDDQVLAKKEPVAKKLFQPGAGIHTNYYNTLQAYKNAEVVKIIHPPPMYGGPDICIRNCVFLI